MEDMLRELTELELAEVAGGWFPTFNNSPYQNNNSQNNQSAGNNNNNGSGNQEIKNYYWA
jgi:hypothetical protein